jgi:hypothetical protein
LDRVEPFDPSKWASIDIANMTDAVIASTFAPTTMPTMQGFQKVGQTVKRQAKKVVIRMQLLATELQGPTGRLRKRALERGFEKAVGCLIACLEDEFQCERGWKSKYCRVFLTKVGDTQIEGDTQLSRRRLEGGSKVEFDIEDTTEGATNLAAIEENIATATQVSSGGDNTLLSSMQAEAFAEGVLTPQIAAMTASEMGEAVTTDTTVTTTVYADVADSVVDQQADTGEANTPVGDDAGASPAAAVGGAVGGLLVIALFAALYVKQSKAGAPKSEAGKEMRGQTVGNSDGAALSIEVHQNFENPMTQESQKIL